MALPGWLCFTSRVGWGWVCATRIPVCSLGAWVSWWVLVWWVVLVLAGLGSLVAYHKLFKLRLLGNPLGV